MGKHNLRSPDGYAGKAMLALLEHELIDLELSSDSKGVSHTLRYVVLSTCGCSGRTKDVDRTR